VDNVTPKAPGKIRFAIAVAWSYIESWGRRLDMLLTPRPRSRNGHERRRNPRHCQLCGGPMRPDSRPPRVTRGVDGKIRNVPGDVLAWFRCGRCHGSQYGVWRTS